MNHRSAVFAVLVLVLLCALPAAAIAGEDKPKEPKGDVSPTVAGKDCGKVKRAIGEWWHAVKVGRASGALKNARDEATKAAAVAASAGKAATAAAKVATSVGGERAAGFASDAEKAAASATEAAKEAEAAAGDAGLLADKHGEHLKARQPWKVKGEGVEEMRKETGRVTALAKKTLQAAEEAEKAAKRTLASVKSIAGDAADAANKVQSSGEAQLKSAKVSLNDMEWVLKSASNQLTKSKAALAALKKKVSAVETEQKPVWEAKEKNLEAQITQTETLVTEHEAEKTKLTSALEAAEASMAPVRAAAVSKAEATGAKGAKGKGDLGADMKTAAKKLDELRAAEEASKGAEKVVEESAKRLKAETKKYA